MHLSLCIGSFSIPIKFGSRFAFAGFMADMLTQIWWEIYCQSQGQVATFYYENAHLKLKYNVSLAGWNFIAKGLIQSFSDVWGIRIPP